MKVASLSCGMWSSFLQSVPFFRLTRPNIWKNDDDDDDVSESDKDDINLSICMCVDSVSYEPVEYSDFHNNQVP
jgi:hypothetical protein